MRMNLEKINPVKRAKVEKGIDLVEKWNKNENIIDKTQLLERIKIKRYCIILKCQYLVDGQFEIDKQDLTYSKVKYAGSTNQRIIDIIATMNNKGEIVLYE